MAPFEEEWNGNNHPFIDVHYDEFVKIVQRFEPRKVRGPRVSSGDEKDEKREM